MASLIRRFMVSNFSSNNSLSFLLARSNVNDNQNCEPTNTATINDKPPKMYCSMLINCWMFTASWSEALCILASPLSGDLFYSSVFVSWERRAPFAGRGRHGGRIAVTDGDGGG